MAYVYFLPRWADPNQDSRLKMVVAVVEDHSFQIDKYLGTTVDYAKVDGHYYSDKAPGVAFLGIPVYALLHTTFDTPLVSGLMDQLENNPSFQASLNPEGTGVNETKIRFAIAQVVISVFAGAIPTALLGVLIFRWLALFMPYEGPRLIIALSYGLLTPAFAYANTMYGHQLSAALLFGAFTILSTATRRLSAWALISVGGLLGYAFITEYPVAIMVGILFAYGVFRLYQFRQLQSVFWIGVLAVPIAVGWMLYNQTIFGGPLNLGYSYSELWTTQHSSGFMSLSIPRLDAAWGITFGFFRGLFIISPWLILGVLGYKIWWQEKVLRFEWWISLACLFGMFLFNSSSIMWWGGFAIGPRYLLPAIPFLAAPAAFVITRWNEMRWSRVIIVFLFAWSAVTVWGLTLAGQSFPSDTISNPLVAYMIPKWVEGSIARNLGVFFSLGSWYSFIPLLAGLGILAAAWKGLGQKYYSPR